MVNNGLFPQHMGVQDFRNHPTPIPTKCGQNFGLGGGMKNLPATLAGGEIGLTSTWNSMSEQFDRIKKKKIGKQGDRDDAQEITAF